MHTLKAMQKKVKTTKIFGVCDEKAGESQNEIYDHIAEGIRIRSRCDWYEQGDKSKKFF